MLKNQNTLKNDFAEQCNLKGISLENRGVVMLPSTRKWFEANGDLKAKHHLMVEKLLAGETWDGGSDSE